METQSLMHLVRDVSPTLYLTLHSFGQDILIPYGYAVGAKPENYQQLVSEVNLMPEFFRDKSQKRAPRR